MQNDKALIRGCLRKALSFMSFEIISYFDIRISDLVADRGRARFSSVISCNKQVFLQLFIEVLE